MRIIQEMPMTEMPHARERDFGFDFDFELEKKSSEEIIDLMDSLMSGKEVEDQFGNVVQLENSEDKKRFSNYVKSNPITFLSIVKAKLNPQEMKLFNMIINY